MKPTLSVRQAEIAALVARGHPVKIIAAETGLAVKTVQEHIYQAASRIPGPSTPRHRLMLWFFNIETD